MICPKPGGINMKRPTATTSAPGATLAFGEPVSTHFDISRADVILSLDADFTYSGPGNVRYARDFARGRRLSSGNDNMNRLYMVESTPTCTGSRADHRMALGSGEIESFCSVRSPRAWCGVGFGGSHRSLP